MIKVTLIGTGALARNLYKAFSKCDQIHLEVRGRSENQFDSFSKTKCSTDFNTAHKADLILLAVSDTAVSECEQLIGTTTTPIAHCAGSLSIDTLKSANVGVFYPLQTFNKITTVEFKEVPILIEASNQKTLSLLRTVGSLISNRVSELHSEKRKEAHLAAVFANNFSNYLFGVSKELLDEFDLPEHLLDALILQTAKNAISNSPKLMQSGPAKRNDQVAIDGHLNMLYDPHYKKLYQYLSKAITDKNYEL